MGISPVHGLGTWDWIAQSLVLCPTNVQPLLGVVGDALGHLLVVAAELAQHVAWGGVVLKHQAKMVVPSRSRGGITIRGKEGGINSGEHQVDSLQSGPDQLPE